MRIAVVTIAKDEAKHAQRWCDFTADADVRVVLDTGSTDGTQDILRENGVVVHEQTFDPWRFDHARNAALELVPDDVDVVVTLDMDEVLCPPWRNELEAHPNATRYRYDYVWSFKDDGSPDVQFRADRIHKRRGYRWKHPVHEVLEQTSPFLEEVAETGLVIHHLADNSKPRTQYLPLLELAVAEAPDDDRQAHYYARELMFAGRWDEARVEFMRHLSMPSAVWADERAESYRFLAHMDYHPHRWLLKACSTAPWRRECWVDLARWYEKEGRMVEARGAAATALSITDRTGSYMEQADAWDDEQVSLIGQEESNVNTG